MNHEVGRDSTLLPAVAALSSLPPEVLTYLLSFLHDPFDLCSVAEVSRAFAVHGRDDSLWRPLGHPSWVEARHVGESAGGWKRAYMMWLRTAVAQYRKRSKFSNEVQKKLVMDGSWGVGKTSLLWRYLHDSFYDQSLPSLGAAFSTKRINLPDGTQVQLQLWDPSGPERYRVLAPMWYRNASAMVMIYDITSRESFDYARTGLQNAKENLPPDVSLVLVGNKNDLAPHKRVVTEQEGLALAQEWQIPFRECSAKTGAGVHDAFDTAVAALWGMWQRVCGMDTPRHVPSEATLAALLAARTGSVEPQDDDGDDDKPDDDDERSTSRWCLLQ